MTMRALRVVGRVFIPALAFGAFAVAMGSASCAATPTPIPVRSFDRAQKVAFACLQVNYSTNGATLPNPMTAPESTCPPVAPNVVGSTLAYHYYALVTQATRGELAVVDLTAGNIVDEDRSTPGANFIPVGAIPTDVAVSPVAALGGPGFTYVASADPNGYALYTIPNEQLLGDSTGSSPMPPLRLTDLMACSLPQPPIALAIVATSPSSAANDSDGGDAGPGCASAYAVAVLLQASAGAPAQIMMVDPSAMTCKTQRPGDLPACTGVTSDARTTATGGLTGPFSSALLGASSAAGVVWPDGVPYGPAGATVGTSIPVDAGLLPDAAGLADTGASTNPDAGVLLGAVDAGPGADLDAGASGGFGPTADGGTAAQAPGPSGSNGTEAGASSALSIGPIGPSQPTSMLVRDDAPVLYVADGAVPLIHVIDVSNPAAPVEVSSFLATSQAQPSRLVSVGALALSPPTTMTDPVTGRALRYLYAIDANDGTLMVFDATQPIPAPFTPPLQRPHPELNPFAPRDRLAFAAPVAAIAFVRHDWPLFPPNPPQNQALLGYSGLVCNPNSNTRSGDTIGTMASQYGAYYAADQASTIQPQGSGVQGFPDRLRGVFGFATLSNGTTVAIDVDDWDAPCRRPDPMDGQHITGVLALPQMDAGAALLDLDPYHAPTAHPVNGSASWVTQETFFPVSAPNRIRSAFLLRDDPTAGKHTPNVTGTPLLFNAAGAPLAGSGATEPLMLPTALSPGFVDPSYYSSPTDPNDNYGTTSSGLSSADAQAAVLGDAGAALFPSETATAGVRIAFDDPTAHMDQDWTVTYEGALPSVSPIVANLDSTDGFQSLLLTVGGSAPSGGPSAANARFCGLGIEDWAIGQTRAKGALAAMQSNGLPVPALAAGDQLPRWTSDYIEITDDLLPSNDPYWNTEATLPDGTPGDDDCWQGTGLQGSGQASGRYNLCSQTYGQYGSNADSHLARDFPIAEAYDGSLIIGRFGFPSGPAGSEEQTTNRTVVGKDPSNVLFLKSAACCFHHQASFKVRTGGEWVALGQNGLGLLHHVVSDSATGRCVLSQDPHDALLNARAFDVPYFEAANCAAPATPLTPISRDSSLAMRNPMFSFLMWAGCSPLAIGGHTTTTRDLTWRFSMRGGFTPLSISLSGGSDLPIVPQSMAFAPAFGQLAIVDGSYQGLILIDLNTLGFAHAPYF